MVLDHGSNFVVDNVRVNNADNIYNISQSAEDPYAKLLEQCAVEATHESSTAAYAPRCKQGTRRRVIHDIMQWTYFSEKPILWFSGPAGGGKTCIQREVARQAADEGILAGSYFFSSRIQGLNTDKPFIATLVHQLSNAIPEFGALVPEAIRNQPGIFQKSLDFQLKHLILDILPHLPPTVHRRIYLLVIDGFDECRSVTQRRHLLHLILALVTNPHLPFRVVIASRPELDIRTAFGCAPLLSFTHFIRLGDYDGTDDIRAFFCDEFMRIRENHPSGAFIPAGWPPEEDIEELVLKASSQFIFASTVIKYVDNPRQNPVTLLRRVFEYSKLAVVGKENPFAELDALYALVLHPPEADLDLIRLLLHTIMVLSNPQSLNWRREPTFLDGFLDLEPGTASMALCDLHSVLDIPSDGSHCYIRFHHKSLEDYLTSPSRSGDLYQSLEETHLSIAMCASSDSLGGG